MKRFAVFLATAAATLGMIVPVYATGEESATQTIGDVVSEETSDADDQTSEESAEGSSGQPGDTVYDTSSMEGRSVAVTFNLDVPSDVTTPCVVSFIESESYKEYYVQAYKTADYSVTEYIAPGTYIITDGGPIDDNISAYGVVDKSYFTVSDDDGAITVGVVIRSKGDILRGDAGASTESAAEETTTAEETVETEKPDYTLWYILAALFFLAIGAGAGIIGMKYLQSQEL